MYDYELVFLLLHAMRVYSLKFMEWEKFLQLIRGVVIMVVVREDVPFGVLR